MAYTGRSEWMLGYKLLINIALRLKRVAECVRRKKICKIGKSFLTRLKMFDIIVYVKESKNIPKGKGV